MSIYTLYIIPRCIHSTMDRNFINGGITKKNFQILLYKVHGLKYTLE